MIRRFEGKKMKVVFLDRDGVVNRYPGDKKYVLALRQFKFLKGSLSAIKSLSFAGYRIFVVSNQAGVAKGLYSKKTLKQITDYMLNEVKKSGARINKVLYCTHLKEEDCYCRKPKDGLLKKAVGNKQLDLENSYFIGDSLVDVKAGRSFGCKTVLVLSGREKLKNSALWDVAPDFIAKSLFDAAHQIISGGYARA